MHKALSVVVPVLVSLFLIQIMSDVLYVRAVGYQPVETDSARGRRAVVPSGPVHEIDREASAGAIIT
jgi:hypothetical protein